MATLRTVLQRRGITRLVLLAWLLATLAFVGECMLLWPFLTTGVVDARSEMAGTFFWVTISWYTLGLALQAHALGTWRTKLLLLPPLWHLLVATLESALAGVNALLAFGPTFNPVVHRLQMRRTGVLEFVQMGLLGIFLLAAVLCHWVLDRQVHEQHQH